MPKRRRGQRGDGTSLEVDSSGLTREEREELEATESQPEDQRRSVNKPDRARPLQH